MYDIPDEETFVLQEPCYTDVEEAIKSALDLLPFSISNVLVLHYYSGYSFVEIAEMEETDPTSIRMRAHRGRAQLAAVALSMIYKEVRPTQDALSTSIKTWLHA